MSEQDEQRIPLVYNLAQQGLRLLELPPELLDALTSPDPPRYLILPLCACHIEANHFTTG